MPMSSGIVTLSGSAQNLATALAIAPTDLKLQVGWLSIQADTANANLAYLGTDANVSTTYFQRIEVPVATIPAAPTIVEDAKGMGLTLSGLYVIGTLNQKLRVGWMTV